VNLFRSRRGVTLIELLVVLALLGLSTAIVGLAFSGAEPLPLNSTALAAIASARREALSSRRPVATSISVDGRVYSVSALPDGSIIGDSLFGAERLTGRRRHAR
jgi:prepilin-type N-terminal cleavage/methylation domain-containing protein